MRHQITVTLTAANVKTLNTLTANAIARWPALKLDVPEDLLALHAKAMLIQQELER